MKPLSAAKPETLPVLLIEDEPAVMAYVRATLERNGYAVVCSASGAEGLRLLESGEFLGVVSDMRTPGGVNGADVHAWVVQHRPEMAGRIIFITGDIANEETVTEFLAFSKARGNDLSTPLPEFGFPGLEPGDRWCLCAARWREAFDAGSAPRVILGATHEATLGIVDLQDLKRYALDLA